MILLSSPARASSSRLDMWVMELSRAAVAASSWMGLRVRRIVPALRNRLAIREMICTVRRIKPAHFNIRPIPDRSTVMA